MRLTRAAGTWAATIPHKVDADWSRPAARLAVCLCAGHREGCVRQRRPSRQRMRTGPPSAGPRAHIKTTNSPPLPVTFITPEKTEHRSIVSFSRNRQNMLQLDLCVAGTTVTHNMQLRVKNYLWCANEAPSRQGEVLFWTRPVHAGDTAMRFRFACALHLKQFMHQVLTEPYEDGLNRIVNQ